MNKVAEKVGKRGNNDDVVLIPNVRTNKRRQYHG